MKAKFTSGNWQVIENSAGAVEVITDSNEYLSIGIASGDKECTKGVIAHANAHLISAAPDGFALGELIIEQCCQPGGISVQQSDLLYQTALSFINKCNGE